MNRHRDTESAFKPQAKVEERKTEYALITSVGWLGIFNRQLHELKKTVA